MHFIERIDQWAAIRSGELAFVHRDDRLTYHDLKTKSDALAAWLLFTLKDSKKSPIIVYGHKESDMLVSFLAAVKSGRPYIPIDSSTPLQRVQEIVESANPALIIDLTESIPVGPNSISVIGKRELEQAFATTTTCPGIATFVQNGDDYYIIYTSGSSGKPKGVRITLGCLESFTTWAITEFIEQGDFGKTFMNQAPFSFDLSVMDLYMSLLTGGTLWCIDKDMIAKPKDLFNGFQDSGINIWVSTPSFAEYCLVDRSFGPELLPYIDSFVFCGEVLTHSCAERLRQRFPDARVFNTYGPTECTVAITSVQVTDAVLTKHDPLPIGYIKGENLVTLLDDGKLVTDDLQQGEIVISGPCVSKGYLNDSERTELTFSVEGGVRSYKTGDCGYFSNGLLFYSGRKDNQIKIHGFRVELEEIDHKIKSLPYISQAVVVSKALQEKNQYLQAGVLLSKEAKIDRENITPLSIKKDLKRILPDYMIPHKIVILDSVPMTSNGKIDRKKVAEVIL